MSEKLKSFPDRIDGYKKDERGSWSDNGTHNIRHSVDLQSDGSINEHVVIKNKNTGNEEKVSNTYVSASTDENVETNNSQVLTEKEQRIEKIRERMNAHKNTHNRGRNLG